MIDAYKVEITDPNGEVIFETEMDKEEVEMHAMTKTQRIKRIADKIVHVLNKTDG
jgi:hypothetical protein